MNRNNEKGKEKSMNQELIKEQEQVRTENKKADKKAFLPFIAIIIISMICGGIFGAFSEKIESLGVEVLGEKLWQAILISMPYVQAGVIVVLVVIGFGNFYKYKKTYRNNLALFSGDELLEKTDEIEYKLNGPLVLSSVCMMIGLFEVAVVLCGLEKSAVIPCMIGLLEFVVIMVLIVILQQKLINFEKEINPEKKGSVYENNFSKKWMESCDEAERSMVYEACYAAYQATTKTCIFLWLVLTCGNMIFHTGMLPVAAVMIIWAVQTLSYCAKSVKLEKERFGEK